MSRVLTLEESQRQIVSEGIVHRIAMWRVKGMVCIARCWMGFKLGGVPGYESYYFGILTDNVTTCIECASHVH